MSLWSILGIVALAGGIGGVVNALLTDNGFIKPVSVQVDGLSILRPGIIGNIIVSAVAALPQASGFREALLGGGEK